MTDAALATLGERRTDPERQPDPAPQSTMIAVLGRIVSHAGEVSSVVMRGGGRGEHTIVVTVADRETLDRWRREVDASPDVPLLARGIVASSVCLHGWSLTIRLERPGA